MQALKQPRPLRGGDPADGGAPAPTSTPDEVIAFWREAGLERWFAKDAEFDDVFRTRFAAAFEEAARGGLSTWTATAEGALALSILLDQYPRNSFRGTPRMYATDANARSVADEAIRAGHHLAVEPALALFFVLPFGHSEDPADQDRAVALAAALGAETLRRAEHHRDIIRRFGRFPHRNAILGRQTTAEEQGWLDAGGYTG